MFDSLQYIATKVHPIIAFAGGVGSGGGGGGGGGGGASAGGGGGSGGGNLGILLIIGLFIGWTSMHVIGAFIRRHKKKEAEWVAGQIIGWEICLGFCICFCLLGIIVSGIFFSIAIVAPIGMAAGLYDFFGIKQSKKTELALLNAEKNDSTWDESKVIEYGKSVFMKYQADWSSYNTENMKSYMTESYFNHASLMIAALKLANRKDLVNDPVIDRAVITSVSDSTDNSKDNLIIVFSAHANDQLIDTITNKVLYTDKNMVEFWKFVRSGNTWLLSGIQPSTESSWTHNISLETFAAQEGFFYSLDWGYLLLPSKGQIFGEGKFGISDINNHIIGLYKNILIQLYTYTPNPQSSNKKFLIAQTVLPRSYGNIVVRQNKKLQLGIRGLEKVSMEWGQFNSRYEVYATSPEQATSFELLNPLYMQKLQALNFEVNMEVVNNILYMYTPIKYDASTSNLIEYKTILNLLKDAFEQMKM